MDVWRRGSVKKDGTEYYEYILCYVDDCLVISDDPKIISRTLKDKLYNYVLKDEGVPKRYLGAKVGTYDLAGERT